MSEMAKDNSGLPFFDPEYWGEINKCMPQPVITPRSSLDAVYKGSVSSDVNALVHGTTLGTKALTGTYFAPIYHKTPAEMLGTAPNGLFGFIREDLYKYPSLNKQGRKLDGAEFSDPLLQVRQLIAGARASNLAMSKLFSRYDTHALRTRLEAEINTRTNVYERRVGLGCFLPIVGRIENSDQRQYVRLPVRVDAVVIKTPFTTDGGDIHISHGGHIPRTPLIPMVFSVGITYEDSIGGIEHLQRMHIWRYVRAGLRSASPAISQLGRIMSWRPGAASRPTIAPA